MYKAGMYGNFAQFFKIHKIKGVVPFKSRITLNIICINVYLKEREFYKAERPKLQKTWFFPPKENLQMA